MNKKKIAVIGGGVSGMEAAAKLAALGMQPVLIEATELLGGHVAQWDRLFPQSCRAEEILQPLFQSLDGVDIHLETDIIEAQKKDGNGFHLTLSNGYTVDVAAVLLTTGFSLFAAQRKEEYGYGIYDRVLSSANLESLFKKEKGLAAKSEDPLKIGFVHCVGSRDEKVCNRHCSKVCCATAVKQACELKELHPNAQVYCFYMDLRMFGREYEDMYLRAQSQYGIQFIRGRVSEVAENIEGKLLVKAEDTLAGKPIRATLDYLILMSGMERHEQAPKMAELFGLTMAEDGFYQTKDAYTQTLESEQPGVFFAGTCTGPKTLIESLSEARAAAMTIYNYIHAV